MTPSMQTKPDKGPERRDRGEQVVEYGDQERETAALIEILELGTHQIEEGRSDSLYASVRRIKARRGR